MEDDLSGIVKLSFPLVTEETAAVNCWGRERRLPNPLLLNLGAILTILLLLLLLLKHIAGGAVVVCTLRKFRQLFIKSAELIRTSWWCIGLLLLLLIISEGFCIEELVVLLLVLLCTGGGKLDSIIEFSDDRSFFLVIMIFGTLSRAIRRSSLMEITGTGPCE